MSHDFCFYNKYENESITTMTAGAPKGQKL